MSKQDNEQRLAKLKNIVLSMPEKPGSYQYYDENHTIIYVGKAKNLKRRVSSYFHKEVDRYKTKVLVSKIHDISYTVVNTEEDALLLENSLIKKYNPKYNVLLKDGKTYEFIQIAANNVANNNIVVTFKNDDNRLVGKTVKIDTNSANIQVNKETAVTNSLGQIDFDLSGSREGTYYVYLSCDGFEVKLQVKVGNTTATYISTSSQPDAPIALYGDKDDLDIRVDLTDVNGNVVTGSNPNGAMNAYTSATTATNYKYVAFVTKPAGTVLKDSDLAIV